MCVCVGRWGKLCTYSDYTGCIKRLIVIAILLAYCGTNSDLRHANLPPNVLCCNNAPPPRRCLLSFLATQHRTSGTDQGQMLGSLSPCSRAGRLRMRSPVLFSLDDPCVIMRLPRTSVSSAYFPFNLGHKAALSHIYSQQLVFICHCYFGRAADLFPVIWLNKLAPCKIRRDRW